MARKTTVALACVLTALSPLAFAGAALPVGADMLMAHLGACIGAMNDNLGMLASTVMGPQAERVFSLQALVDVLGTGVMTAALIAPTAFLADWAMGRREDSADNAGEKSDV